MGRAHAARRMVHLTGTSSSPTWDRAHQNYKLAFICAYSPPPIIYEAPTTRCWVIKDEYSIVPPSRTIWWERHSKREL